MSVLASIIAVTIFYLLPGAFNALALRYAHPGLWRRRWFRAVAYAVPLAGLAMCFYWIASFESWGSWASGLGISAFGVLILQLALAGALAITGGATWLGRRLATIRRRRRNARGEGADAATAAAEGIDPVRRRVWQGGLVALPLLAAGTSVSGVAQAAAPVRVFRLPLALPNLPADLAGLRILQISDLHLAGFVRVETVADILHRARPLAPDLVVLTGDTADDPRLLPETLALVADFGARLGAYAVLGNHEYSHQLELARAHFAASSVRLLDNEPARLPVGRATVHLAGVDDFAGHEPGETKTVFYRRCIAKTLAGSRDGDFRLLLSHRPDAFDEAARQGVDLTLAGHTHGGQIGVAGRSLLLASHLYPYPWGHYRHGDSHLYTTSGAGHWIPFRLGCPTEAPVIELVPPDGSAG